MLDTPVALSVYNRPRLAAQVFGAIAQAEPKQLFVFADGPRTSKDAKLCAQALAEAQKLTWDCDVRYDVSTVNLGPRGRWASALDWVFSEVDEAIILEEDCLPDATFFPYCEQLLERYRDDTRVMAVSGSNYLERWKEDRQSYHFSHFGGLWGWASWKRAWATYDVTMAGWGDDEVKARIRNLLADDEVFAFQARRFDRLYSEPNDRHSWDLPWSFARLANGGLTVVPAVNLVTNRGNTDGRGLPPAHPLANLSITPMAFPLRSPAHVAVDRDYDRLHVRRIHEWWSTPAAIEARSVPRSGARRGRIARKLRASLHRARKRLRR